jgi:hypothetical protein
MTVVAPGDVASHRMRRRIRRDRTAKAGFDMDFDSRLIAWQQVEESWGAWQSS